MVNFIWLLTLAECIFASGLTDVLPVYYSIGIEPTIEADNVWTRQSEISLTPQSPVATFDYGTDVAGFPFINVHTLDGPTQIELKYSEQFPGLESPLGDGPWTFTNGLSNTFRTETFNLTKTGRVQSFFVQGGQRWVSVQLLTNASVALSVGFNSTVSRLPPSQLPGSFEASDGVYNKLFDLGGRAAQVACVDAYSLPPTWQITPDGALIEGQQTAQSAKGGDFANYTLSFLTKIVRGGTGFRVASGILPYGSYFVITSNYPTQSTYVNVNRTLLPPNHLVYDYAWSIVNQTSLLSPQAQYFPLNISIEEDVWYNVSTTLGPSGYSISLNGTLLALVSYQEAEAFGGSFSGSASPQSGTWGFGPFQNQAAYFKDVRVVANNGSLLYSNLMTSTSVLGEYSIATNQRSVCLDGAKRDRLVWIGDFVHTCRTLAATTHKMYYARGTIAQAFDWQIEEGTSAGFVGMSTQLGARPEYIDAFASVNYLLVDYQDLFLVSIGDYYRLTGDLTFLGPYWTRIKAIFSRRLKYIDLYSGLQAGEGAFFLGPINGTAISALSVLALRNILPLAKALGDTATLQYYNQVADKLSNAINSQLWNPALGAYSLSLESPGNFSIASIAFTIRAGIANATQTASMLSKLPSLRVGIGFKDSTLVESSNTTNLSPNTQGFLLESLFIANRAFGTSLDSAAVLLNEFWPVMVSQNKYYSGSSWEYTYPDGSPGLDLFTSLAHPWGSAPSYVLPQYLLGVEAISPGYAEWRFQPLLSGLGLRNASGSVPTPFGNIEASWVLNGSMVVASVIAPNRTEGIVVLPNSYVVVSNSSECGVGGRDGGAYTTTRVVAERR